MIATLRGRVVAIGDDELVVETGGVGYQVFSDLRTVAALREGPADDVTLHIHTSVAEDAIRLFGFGGRDELRLFRLLIGVERIGPRAALGIMGRSELPALVRAIREGDVGTVALAPGVGRKTAERVVLELRDRLDSFALPPAGAPPAAPAREAVVARAVEGLVGLGFREAAARAAVVEAAGDGAGLEDAGALVSAALRRLDTAVAAR